MASESKTDADCDILDYLLEQSPPTDDYDDPVSAAESKGDTIRIAHLADIHIKDERRDEYKVVFTKLYAKLREEKPDIIVIAGDVFDSTTKASANNFTDVTEFLLRTSEVAPTVLIAGNHDTNVRAPGGPDLLTPIISIHPHLQPPRLTYFRHSGAYAAHGIIWAVLAVDDIKTTTAILNQKCDALGDKEAKFKSSPRILLFHDEVGESRMSSAMGAPTSPKLHVRDFRHFDIAIGGHIHLRQGGPRWAYCGSLVQQNISEPHAGHGFLIWEVKTENVFGYRTHIPKRKGIDIQNPNGYLWIEFREGKEITKDPRPEKPYDYRIWYDLATPPESLDPILEEFKQQYGRGPRAIQLNLQDERKAVLEESKGKGHAEGKKKTVESVHEVRSASTLFETHELAIREILGKKHALMKDIIELHKREFKLSILPNIAIRGRSLIRLLDLRFKNILCFGETENYVTFGGFERAISGACASNFMGKSAFLHALSFLLWDECPLQTRKKEKRAFLNLSAKSLWGQLRFEVDGKIGVITKKRGATTKHSDKSEYEFEFDGERFSGDLSFVNAEIQKVVGDYETAQLTSMIYQRGGEDILRMTNTERKSAIARILDLGLPENLDKKYHSQRAQERKAITVLKEEADEKTVAQLKSDIKTLEAQIRETGDKISSTREELQSLESSEKEETKVLCELTARFGEGVISNLSNALREQEIQFKQLLSVARTDSMESVDSELKFYQASKFSIIPQTKQPATAADIHMLKKRLDTTTPNADEQSLERLRSTIKLAERSLRELEDKIIFAKKRLITRSHPKTPRPSIESPWPIEKTDSASTVMDEKNTENVKAQLTQILGDCTPETISKIQDKLLDISTHCKPIKITELPDEMSLLEKSESINMRLRDGEQKIRQHQQTVRKHIADIQTKLVSFPAALVLASTNGEESPAPRDVSTDELSKAADHAKLLTAKLLASKQASSLLAGFDLKEGCPGCTQVHTVLSPQGLKQQEEQTQKASHSLKSLQKTAISFLQQKLRERKNEEDKTDTILQKTEQARKHLARLSDLRTERESIAAQTAAIMQRDKYLQALEITHNLEVAAGHWRRAKEIWSEYDRHLEEVETAKKSLDLLAQEKESKLRELELHRDALAKASSTIQEHSSLKSQYTILLHERISFLLRIRNVFRATQQLREKIADKKQKGDEKTLTTKKISEQQAIVARTQESLAQYRQSLETFIADLARDETLLISLCHRLKKEEKRKKSEDEAQRKFNLYDTYLQVIRPKNGIADKLLARARHQLTTQINNTLAEIEAGFTARFTIDWDVCVTTRNKKEMSVLHASGYQLFACSLALRIALWRLADHPMLDAIFLDETLSVCDSHTLPALLDHLAVLARSPAAPRLFFLVSHLDTVHSALDTRTLTFTTTPTGTLVRNTFPPVKPSPGASSDRGDRKSA